MHGAVRQAVILKRWSPRALGPSLLGWWDAEDLSTLDLSGANVTTWRDRVAGYAATQTTSGFKPVWGASSFNGRPGVTFDGTDDGLTYAAVPFPVGATGCEIWALVSQDALAADTTTRYVFGYGGGTTATARRLSRTVSAGVNRATILSGDGASSSAATSTAADFSGRHVLRGVHGPAITSIAIDGTNLVTVNVVPATGSLRTRIGQIESSSTGFFAGVIAATFVTMPLSDLQAAQLTAYLKSRGGIA